MYLFIFLFFSVNCTCTFALYALKEYNQRAEKTGYDILIAAFWASQNALKKERRLLSWEQMLMFNRKKVGGQEEALYYLV